MKDYKNCAWSILNVINENNQQLSMKDVLEIAWFSKSKVFNLSFTIMCKILMKI